MFSVALPPTAVTPDKVWDIQKAGEWAELMLDQEERFLELTKVNPTEKGSRKGNKTVGNERR